MGLDIDKTTFSETETLQFRHKLDENLSALKALLDTPDFGQKQKGQLGLGAELEMYLIDEAGLPACINEEILADANDAQLTLELNRYNLEYNLTPYDISQQAFEKTEQEILQQLNRLGQLAKNHGGRVIPIGILPTLQREHFGPQFMTDRKRYHALVQQLIKRRGSNFKININGQDPLQFEMSDVTLEGANTSFQIHYRVAPQDYVNTFNAFQLVTPLVVAIAANSPGIFGHSLWHETRIPLFKQSIDSRDLDRYRWHEPSRVNFGHGWVRQSPLELFQESAHVYPPLLPICSDEQPLEMITDHRTPGLAELRLQQSTVWHWNRPVYDDADKGHLRIEMRALPAGPSAIDMTANAALYIGLAEALKDQMPLLTSALPFRLAEYNFYRAAQSGINAQIIWPLHNKKELQPEPLLNILSELLPRAREALLSIGVSENEANKYMHVIEQRVQQQQTGSTWQQQKVAHYQQNHESAMAQHQAQHRMLEDYIANSLSNTPVSQWD